MTTTRFGLLEIDDVPGTTPNPRLVGQAGEGTVTRPDGTERPFVKQAGESTARDGELDLEGRARAIEVDRALAAQGLAFDEPTFFAWGTKGQWGDAAKRARAELHAMPLHRELAEEARAIVAKESRRGDVVNLDAIKYGLDDKVRTQPGSAGARCSPQALKQLLLRADAPGGAYLPDARLPGGLRAAHVNHWLEERNEREEEHRERQNALNGKLPAHQKAKLLSKLNADGERCLYGAVGPKYPHDYGMDRVIADVQGMFPGEARGTLHYDASTTRWKVDACVGAEFEPVVGDVYRMGVRYGAHDAGGGSYYADLYGIRVRCVNFTKIHGSKRLGRVRHVGTVDELQARVKALIEVGAEAVAAYSAAVREANEQAICERALAGDGDAKAVFAALIDGGYLPAPGGAEAAGEAYFNAWLAEPGHNRIDFVNAATRAAHESPWSSPWVTEEIEEAASNLLYQRLVLTEAQVAATA